MDNVVNTSDVDLDYTLIYKDRDLILDNIGFDKEDDRLICEAIIDNLEQEVAKNIKLGNNISIPFLGTIERNWYKQGIRDNFKELKEYKNTHSEEEYKEYFNAVCNNIKADHKELEDKHKRQKRFKSKVLPRYVNLCKNRSVVYANAWLKTLSFMTVVEFDPEIEEVYERFRLGLDADD